MVSACTGAVHSFAGLAVCRVVLGFTEAAFFPGVSSFHGRERDITDVLGYFPTFDLLRKEEDGTSNCHLVLWFAGR